jgi:hypothetical protein
VGVMKGAYTEYHVCGDLTLSGSGDLTGNAPASDTVIVVENGDVVMADNAAISTRRVTFVLTGNNTHSSSITFPKGKGKAASLTLSPSTANGNPWRGISLYQDPDLTKDVDHKWGPGVTFNPDGVVYLPNASVTMSGSGASGVTGCTKFIANTFRTNGSVDLEYRQTETNCKALGVDQWFEPEPYLSE